MKCSRGQLRSNGACCARANARVRFQLRTAFSLLSREYCKSRPELISIIQGLTSSLQKKGVSVRYQWVPSHVGLSGNEQADLIAKTRAQRVGRPDLTLRSSTSDLVRRVNRAAWSLWAKDYRDAALHHNWPMIECQGDSTETFPDIHLKSAI